MGIADSSILDLIKKVRSWISWRGSDKSCYSGEFEMANNSDKMCCECHTNFCIRYHCQSCGRLFCGKCMQGYDSTVVVASNVMTSSGEGEEFLKSCKFCRHEGERKFSGKIYPSLSPRESPEPPSPSSTNGKTNRENIQSDLFHGFLEAQDHGYSPHSASCSSVTSYSGHPSPVAFRHSSSRSDEEETEDSASHFFSPSSEFCQDDFSDIDSSRISAIHDFYNFKSVGSSPSDSPSRNKFTFNSNSVEHSVQREQGLSPISRNDGPFDHEKKVVLKRPETEGPENTNHCSNNLSIFRDQYQEEPLDFENNGLIWFPPPPEDEDDETEDNFFEYDDEDDDIGESGAIFSSSSSLPSMFPAKEKHEGSKEPLRAVVRAHFRALVSQLLQGEGNKASKDNVEDWLDIVTTLAWQAANFVKPDTSRGGSMDPGDYVKVKCIATGSPSESTFIKGIVCTKNIKHKRMTSQYKNPRLLLLGGALEYQRVPNQLSSFNTLLQQEIDHLKMIISKIEAHRPNVLLVEKSVSSYAQEYLLAKEISLVLNVKRPLLERIARCTGALITPSIDSISTTRLGYCELFRLERVSEDLEPANQFNKKPSKTLMFFEGCPRRLGCTVLLKGTCRQELKKLKDVVQYAVFAAYHLSLETSFLADEGASLPKMTLKRSIAIPEREAADSAISAITSSDASIICHTLVGFPAQKEGSAGLNGEVGEWEASYESRKSSDAENVYLTPIMGLEVDSLKQNSVVDESTVLPFDTNDSTLTRKLVAQEEGHHVELLELTKPEKIDENEPSSEYFSATDSHHTVDSLKQNSVVDESTVLPFDTNDSTLTRKLVAQEEGHHVELLELTKPEKIDENEPSSEYFSATDSHHSILVSFSRRCVMKGTLCERSRLLRIKFYGCFDKPLGRYLHDDLFDQTTYCQSCNELTEAHLQCFTHQQGTLTISVRRLANLKLPGERDGNIWMWHRCLRCALKDGIPPATRRVVMSDAAWGLSFGKFLELSFSNHATANRVATCGHSLQRDCLRYYGFGSMVAFFRYTPINILSVHLPPSMIEFNNHVQQDWIRKEAAEIFSKMETLYAEISNVLYSIEHKSASFRHESSESTELHNHIMELKNLVEKERNDYVGLLQPASMDPSLPGQLAVDILELNRLRRSLIIGSHVWDRRLYSLDSLFKTRSSNLKETQGNASYFKLKDWKNELSIMDGKLNSGHEDNISESTKLQGSPRNELCPELKAESSLHLLETDVPEDSSASSYPVKEQERHPDGKINVEKTSHDSIPSSASNLSDQIDSAWTGTNQLPVKAQALHALKADGSTVGMVRKISVIDIPPLERLKSPMRVYSFDSAIRVQDKIKKGFPPSSLHLSTLRSFHAAGEYRNIVRDPVCNVLRTYSHISPREAQKLSFVLTSTPSVLLSASQIAEGARLLFPQTRHGNIVIAVYDNEPTSIISYALSSKEYEDLIADKLCENDRSLSAKDSYKEGSTLSSFSTWQSFGALDMEYAHYGSYGSEDASSSSIGSLFTDTKKSPHLRISFGDESLTAGGKVKFSVTCYFAKQFDTLRKKCCPGEVDFVRSLSRGKRWSAQGGKSNVYFAKSLDERFIIKQVTKTELDSFEEFAPEYFKYLTDSLSSGSPTCVAKILGIYQVSVKHLKSGRETKMDLMVMENLFFKRNISRVYDLKGSVRSRYNPDTTGANAVLLDMNLLETLCTKPIFLGSKAKRSLERAVWNDTSFLASVDVMDYSLLVGVDEERKELVLGIIDIMRQYTWDKHLETWVKASGILGGPKNASPTIISPKQYKRRFRKAMTSYFLTVPDQWSS